MHAAAVLVALGASFVARPPVGGAHGAVRTPAIAPPVAPRAAVPASPRGRALSSVSSPMERPQPRAPAVNLGLLGLLLANQALIAVPTLLLGGMAALGEHGDFNQLTTYALGVLGALPLIAISNAVDASRDERTIPITWATEVLALKMFGLRQEPAVAAAVCLGLGAVVGLVEETAFRGLMLPALADQLGGGLAPTAAALCATSALFAALHLNPLKLAKRGIDGSDLVALGLQLSCGLWFGALSAVPGGNLGIPIVAHCLYDAFVLWSTHLAVSAQYAYAKAEVRADEKHTPTAVQQWAAALGDRFVRDAEYLFHFLDKDRSQTIELYELLVGLRAYGLELRADELNARWDAAGAPADPVSGALDLEHFVAFVGRLTTDVRAAQQARVAAAAAAAAAQTNALRDAEVGGLESKGLLGVRPTQ